MYQAIRPTLRALWSELTIDNLNLTMMEVTFLGFVGRFDEAWTALGVVCRNAQAMGLHREHGLALKDLDVEARQTAKILWWEIYILDRWYALFTSRPMRKQIS